MLKILSIILKNPDDLLHIHTLFYSYKIVAKHKLLHVAKMSGHLRVKVIEQIH